MIKFRLIEAERAQHPVSLLCGLLGVTSAGYYAWRRRGPSLRLLGDAELQRRIVTIYDGSLQTYGAPRIHAELLDEHGVRVGRKRVARLMRELGLAGVSRRGQQRFKTTIPATEALSAPDLAGREFRPAGPDRLWVADIKYVPTWQGYPFPACVLEAWSRKVVGRSMRDDLKAELSTRSGWPSAAASSSRVSSTTATGARSPSSGGRRNAATSTSGSYCLAGGA